jgi:hypothetical protein
MATLHSTAVTLMYWHRNPAQGNSSSFRWLRQAPFGPSLSKFGRVDSETPLCSHNAGAPEVRFNVGYLRNARLCLAIVFIVRTSSFVHARRTTFFTFAILAQILQIMLFLRDILCWQQWTNIVAYQCDPRPRQLTL